MTNQLPLVTILIATKDRPNDLRVTLHDLCKQQYPSLEMLVIDDGSTPSIEPLVREAWPAATVIRHKSSAGQCARRNEGFALAKGEIILQLDDDCSLTHPEAIAHAVDHLQHQPQTGGLACYIVTSAAAPASIEPPALQSGCVAAFVGAAVFFRKTALQQTCGYRAFFGNEWEEEELGLQLLSAGWQIVFDPRLVAHHRLSPINRNSTRTWRRGLRNRLWALVIHVPLHRLGLEIGWKVSVGAWDAVRLMRPASFLRALLEFTRGLPLAWELRKPLSAEGLRRYDALRLQPVISPADFAHPPHLTLAAVASFYKRWRNRARNRNIWDRKPGDTGTSYTVAYAHDKIPGAAHDK